MQRHYAAYFNGGVIIIRAERMNNSICLSKSEGLLRAELWCFWKNRWCFLQEFYEYSARVSPVKPSLCILACRLHLLARLKKKSSSSNVLSFVTLVCPVLKRVYFVFPAAPKHDLFFFAPSAHPFLPFEPSLIFFFLFPQSWRRIIIHCFHWNTIHQLKKKLKQIAKWLAIFPVSCLVFFLNPVFPLWPMPFVKEASSC